MIRFLTLRRASKACDRAAELYRLARFMVGQGDLCAAGRLKTYADVRADLALDALDAAEPYLPAEIAEARP